MNSRFLILSVIFLLSVAYVSAQQTGNVSSQSKPDTALDYRKDGNTYLLVLKPGQPLIGSLLAFMQKEKLPGAAISGIGSVVNTEVAYYNADQKKFIYRKFDQSMEVVSLNGNMRYVKDSSGAHIHISMAGPDYRVYGGHVKEAYVSMILEIFITSTTKPITREWDKEMK